MDTQAIKDAISAVYSALENLEALVPAGEATETGEEGMQGATNPREALAQKMIGA